MRRRWRVNVAMRGERERAAAAVKHEITEWVGADDHQRGDNRRRPPPRTHYAGFAFDDDAELLIFSPRTSFSTDFASSSTFLPSFLRSSFDAKSSAPRTRSITWSHAPRSCTGTPSICSLTSSSDALAFFSNSATCLTA